MSIFFNEANQLVFSLGALASVILAILVLLLGGFIKKKVAFLQEYCIPAPVIGGILFALLNLFFHQTGLVSISLDKAYQNDFQYLFFTAIGFTASLALLKKGGSKLIIYFVLTGCVIVLQGIIGVGGAFLMGQDLVFGIITGPAPLAGGHGSAAAYAKMLEDMGHSGSMVVGMAVATFGLIIGSFAGGPLCGRLISKYRLESSDKDATMQEIKDNMRDIQAQDTPSTDPHSIFIHIAFLGTFVVIGGYIFNIIGDTFSFKFPGFTGPIVMAILMRNILEIKPIIKINQAMIDKIGEISLGIFLSMALISLNLWELFDLAIPMLVILALDVIVILSFIYFVVFRVLGKNFDAAVMCAGMTGHAFGATPNGIANMESVSEKYGISRVAFLIVPIVGGFLQDLILVPFNIYLINLLG